MIFFNIRHESTYLMIEYHDFKVHVYYFSQNTLKFYILILQEISNSNKKCLKVVLC